MRAQASTDGAAPPESSFWIRSLPRLPWGCLYALATALTFIVSRVVRYRRSVVDHNLARAFPGIDATQRRRWSQQHYAGMLDMIIRSHQDSVADG